ncbi:MAG: thioredoxin domain-containing protein [Myxococcota bacterium]|nr:thioredoxin domain-containing protein [Myxococcota bacterium]
MQTVRLLMVSLAMVGCPASEKSPTPDDLRADTRRGAILHPGSLPYSPALVTRLREAFRAHGAAYAPRTKHLRSDGQPKYINRLILSTSPYLLQHAHNPVDWRPWGEDALAEARRLNRPILISVGYSTCHWCHVMEEESFESEAIAKLINELYIPIKIDREERPDLDSVYMAAVYKLNRRGGWPMTVWADPDGLPFFAGTYFPPDGVRGVTRGFQTLLKTLASRWDKEPRALRHQAQRLADAIAQDLKPVPSGVEVSVRSIDDVVSWAMRRYDERWGGLLGQPKFPSSFPVQLLLRSARRSGDPAALDAAVRTLEKIQNGGIHDQLGGGFHRYSVDERWLIPHFEKMLYDNALLVQDFLAAYQVTGRQDFANTVRFTLDYVLREMTRSDGAFYSATDADSDGEEGTFFLWDLDQIRSLLPKEVARSVIAYWGVTRAGNFEGRNILWVRHPQEVVARELKLSVDELKRHLSHARTILYAARAKRVAPGLDDKVMVDWNGLMIGALARASWVLGEPRYLAAAARAADFHLATMRTADGRLHHSTHNGRKQAQSFLADYAFLIHGLIELVQADGDPRWLTAARALQAIQDDDFGDDVRGAWYRTSDHQKAHIVREKPDDDGAIPTGNSYGLHNLLRLATLTGDARYAAAAQRAFVGLADGMRRGAMTGALAALERADDQALELVVVHPDAGATSDLFSVVRSTYAPNAMVFELSERRARALAAEVPWLEGKTALEGRSTAFVCMRGVCKRPCSTAQGLRDQIPPVLALGKPRP